MLDNLRSFLSSSIGKKFIMAASGVILVLFVLGHMSGNLLAFVSPEAINAYAKKLHTLPLNLLWVIRIILLTAVVAHVWSAILLTRENRAARPKNYAFSATFQASYASRTMPMTGFILLSFIIFHLLHFTTRDIFDYSSLYYQYNGEEYFNVYSMMVLGFSKWYVSLFYIVSMALLCLHLSHGASSMFQTLGVSNKAWRKRLDYFAIGYGVVIFIGFVSIPVAVLLGFLEFWQPA